MALASAVSPIGVAVPCALTWSMSLASKPASSIARVIARPARRPSGAGATMWKASDVMPAPISRASGVAPRALACSSVSMIIIAPASPNTNPSRSLSNGRDAPSGSSLRVDIARIIENVAIGSASIMPSTPPQTTMSASPMTICRQACAMASDPDEHAETGVITPARAPSSRPTTAAAPLGMII